MKRTIIISALLIFTSISIYYAQSDNNLEKLDVRIEKAFEDFNLPGLAVGIIKNNEVVFSKSYGEREYGKEEPVTSETQFGIASLSKAFTAACIGMLVDEGKLEWDDKVIKYLPWFKLSDPYVTKELRIVDLLTHRAGYNTFDGDLLWYGSEYSSEEIVKRFRFMPAKQSFRFNYAYSNLMFITAGEVIKAVSGKPWNEFVKERIFTPLGMENSTTTNSDFNESVSFAYPHLEKEVQEFIDYDNCGPAASINSCVDDLLKWLQFWMNSGKVGEEQILSQNSIYKILSSQTVLNGGPGKEIGGRHFMNAGCGWFLSDYAGRKIIAHSGGLPGFISRATFVPEDSLGFVILTNDNSYIYHPIEQTILDLYLTDKDDDHFTPLLDRMKIFKNREAKQKEALYELKKEDTTPSLSLENYAGIYEDKMYGEASVEFSNNKLTLKLLPTEKLFTSLLEHWYDDTFKIKFNDPFLPEGLVTFYIDEGKANEFTIDLKNPDFHFYNLEFKRKNEFKQKADLVLFNGTIVTVDENNPEAEAIAVKGDRIIFVGNDDEVRQYIGDKTKSIDLKGKFTVPGLIDGHAHFASLGKAKKRLDLLDTKSWDEILDVVKKAVAKAKPGEWILGRGWHQEKWNKSVDPNFDGYPVHKELSKISPDNPIYLSHASGHAVFANDKAMQLAGVDKDTKDPEGGRIVRDKNGNPIGVFEENAEQLITDVYQAYLDQRTEEQKKNDRINEIKLAEDECLKYGITSFHDAGQTFENLDITKELAKENRMRVRLHVMIGDSIHYLREKLPDYKLIGYGNHFLNVRAIKVYIDGALGSRGAWLLKPYEDLPNHTGLLVTPLDELQETALLAIDNGFQLCTHAIGDKGNREIINIYEETFKLRPAMTNLRWRVEHAQHLSGKDIPRFGQLGVIAAMQGIHCTSDAPYVYKRLGKERAEEGAYVWRKLIESGAKIVNGTDAPVERVDPFASFYASVTRKQNNGELFFPDQKMTRTEALKSYTINGAYASFEEEIKGSLSVGKLADITVLSNNLLTCEEEEIKNTKAVYTIVGGKILYENNNYTE